QGGIVSPILANIYLHKLDEFMEHTCNQLTAQRVILKRNPSYQELNLEGVCARKNGEIERANDLLKHMRTMHSHDPFDPNEITVNYIRYADDFLVMLSGSKNL